MRDLESRATNPQWVTQSHHCKGAGRCVSLCAQEEDKEVLRSSSRMGQDPRHRNTLLLVHRTRSGPPRRTSQISTSHCFQFGGQDPPAMPLHRAPRACSWWPNLESRETQEHPAPTWYARAGGGQQICNNVTPPLQKGTETCQLLGHWPCGLGGP